MNLFLVLYPSYYCYSVPGITSILPASYYYSMPGIIPTLPAYSLSLVLYPSVLLLLFSPWYLFIPRLVLLLYPWNYSFPPLTTTLSLVLCPSPFLLLLSPWYHSSTLPTTILSLVLLSYSLTLLILFSGTSPLPFPASPFFPFSTPLLPLPTPSPSTCLLPLPPPTHSLVLLLLPLLQRLLYLIGTDSVTTQDCLSK